MNPKRAMARKAIVVVTGRLIEVSARIIAGRPYRTVDDLLKVKGIGPKRLEKFSPYVVVGKE